MRLEPSRAVQVGGGQLWKQPRFPFLRRYVTLLGGPDTRFALLSPPDEVGSCVCTEPDGTWSYTAEGLLARLTRDGYELAGQFAKVSRGDTL